jgi:hypothetical protein
MDNRYANSGALFPVKNKRSDKTPDMSGSVTIDGDVLQSILDAVRTGQQAKIRLTGYNKPSRDGGRFIAVRVYVDDEGARDTRYPEHPAVPIKEQGRGYQNYGPSQGQNENRYGNRHDNRPDNRPQKGGDFNRNPYDDDIPF